MDDTRLNSTVRWSYIVLLYAGHFGLNYLLETGASIVCSLVMAIAATLWARSDARRRGRPMLHVVQMIMLMTWLVSLPIYLIRSRGWVGVGWTLLNLLGLLATSFLAQLAAYQLRWP